ncbi:MAG: hypothetical protein IJZ20_00150, partial [Clostridia bacterium]|nr:hypothetical protein [Clostridia bacterium]
PDGKFAKNCGGKYRVLTSENFEKLELDIKARSKEVMPVTVDDLHWVVSRDDDGRRFLSIFNNEGNYRARPVGDTIDKKADRRVEISFKESANLTPIKLCSDQVRIERADDSTYYVDVPAAGFAIFEF